MVTHVSRVAPSHTYRQYHPNHISLNGSTYAARPPPAKKQKTTYERDAEFTDSDPGDPFADVDRTKVCEHKRFVSILMADSYEFTSVCLDIRT